ncbi:MAG TPA: hypothetical protein DF383_01160 [Deltaproteobacteria bacterium]|nr:hypothetical protein [Deltaproteobacteria bacterium]
MLQALQNWIESTYQLEAESPVGDFLIDRPSLLRRLGSNHPLTRSEEVLLAERRGTEWRLGLYLDAGKEPDNTHQIMTALEGVSHLRLLLHRIREEENLSHLELELQAEIDKFLFFRLDGKSDEEAKLHLRRPSNLEGLDSVRRKTYESARRLAYRYCLYLDGEYLSGNSHDRLYRELRRFYRLSHWQKLQMLGPP